MNRDEKMTYRRGLRALAIPTAIALVLIVVRILVARHRINELEKIPSEAMTGLTTEQAHWIAEYCADAGADTTLCKGSAVPTDR